MERSELRDHYFLIFCLLVLLGLIVHQNAQASAVKNDEVLNAITRLNPNYTEAKELARVVRSTSTKYRLDWRMFLSVLFQESSFSLDPQGCLTDVKKCGPDFGIGQINFKTWGVELGLDKTLLMTDLDYSVDVSAQVLSSYKKRFYTRDALWFTRYFSSTPSLRVVYLKRLLNHYHKIDGVLFFKERELASEQQ